MWENKNATRKDANIPSGNFSKIFNALFDLFSSSSSLMLMPSNAIQCNGKQKRKRKMQYGHPFVILIELLCVWPADVRAINILVLYYFISCSFHSYAAPSDNVGIRKKTELQDGREFDEPK